MVGRPIGVEFFDHILSRIDIDSAPSVEMEEARVREPNRVEAAGVNVDSLAFFSHALQMLDVLSAEPGLANSAPVTRLSEDIAEALGFVERPASRPETKFEKRGLGLGHGVWDLVFHRLDSA